MPRRRATVVLLEAPVTSPASVRFAFVEPTVRFVRPAPFPKNAPTKRLLILDRELTPLKWLESAKVWLPFSKGTLSESRVSPRVPEEILPALSAVKLAPLPLKVPANELFEIGRAPSRVRVLASAKVWLPFSKGTLSESRACPRGTE